MLCTFSVFLLARPWMDVLAAIVASARPKSLREIVDLTGLSPGGVSDVLRRLTSAGIVERVPTKNRILFSPKLTSEEKGFITYAVEQRRVARIKARADLYSKRSRASIAWIDETIRTVNKGRGR